MINFEHLIVQRIDLLYPTRVTKIMEITYAIYHISIVTSAVYSISTKSIFASAVIGSHGVFTHSINIAAVCFVGTLVEI